MFWTGCTGSGMPGSTYEADKALAKAIVERWNKGRGRPMSDPQTPRPFCRDCADNNGVCPADGSFCSPAVQKRHDALVGKVRKEEQTAALQALARAFEKVLSPQLIALVRVELRKGLGR